MNLRTNNKRSATLRKATTTNILTNSEDYDSGLENDDEEEEQLEYKSTKKLKGNNGKPLNTTEQNSQTATTGSHTSPVTTPEKTATAQFIRSSEQILKTQRALNNDCLVENDGFLELQANELHTRLHEVLLSEQTVILRGGAGESGFNANPKELFDFDSVVANHGDTPIECRIQNPTIYDYNVLSPKNYQHTYKTTLREYGEYARLLAAENYEEIKKKSYYKNYFSKLTAGVMFAVNVDMDDYNWNLENMRLRSSLPQYLVNKGKYDFLSYHRQNVMGCTQPQMYLKVPGVWTGGHQENISVRAVNINHGEGESDWYCVDYDQVKKYRNYIKKKYNVDIHLSEGMWFGKYKDPEVAKAGIKIKKVIQRKGDIVILGPGVLHWVRCRGKTVQTAWNFALRTTTDIMAMNDRYLYNKKIDFQTILLNKTLFMDLLNFEYYSLNSDLAAKLCQIVTEYYESELDLQNKLLHSPVKKNPVIFHDQLPAQLRQIQVYYCSTKDCVRELFSYFGVIRSQFQISDSTSQQDQTQDDFSFVGEYFCPQCLLDMKNLQETDQLVVFRRFDLHSLKAMLDRVRIYLARPSSEQIFYPIYELTNISHFCGQITNANDFIFNKDVAKLEQLNIPDLYFKQGFEEMHKQQLDMQEERVQSLSFQNKPILKFKQYLNGSNRIFSNDVIGYYQENLREQDQIEVKSVGKQQTHQVNEADGSAIQTEEPVVSVTTDSSNQIIPEADHIPTITELIENKQLQKPKQSIEAEIIIQGKSEEMKSEDMSKSILSDKDIENSSNDGNTNLEVVSIQQANEQQKIQEHNQTDISDILESIQQTAATTPVPKQISNNSIGDTPSDLEKDQLLEQQKSSKTVDDLAESKQKKTSKKKDNMTGSITKLKKKGIKQDDDSSSSNSNSNNLTSGIKLKQKQQKQQINEDQNKNNQPNKTVSDKIGNNQYGNIQSNILNLNGGPQVDVALQQHQGGLSAVNNDTHGEDLSKKRGRPPKGSKQTIQEEILNGKQNTLELGLQKQLSGQKNDENNFLKPQQQMKQSIQQESTLSKTKEKNHQIEDWTDIAEKLIAETLPRKSPIINGNYNSHKNNVLGEILQSEKQLEQERFRKTTQEDYSQKKKNRCFVDDDEDDDDESESEKEPQDEKSKLRQSLKDQAQLLFREHEKSQSIENQNQLKLNGMNYNNTKQIQSIDLRDNDEEDTIVYKKISLEQLARR